MKPILFNTEMVRAIQNGTKTVTRRVVKPQPPSNTHPNLFVAQPYIPGDILYVRETWCNVNTKEHPSYFYKADSNRPHDFDGLTPWHPSIHMPREAARIFLRVTDVRVEKLNKITPKDIRNEGVGFDMEQPVGSYKRFIDLWDSTIKPTDRALYGWEANPWVWAIEFERCERPEKEDV